MQHYLRFNPCLMACSRSIKKCWRGMWSVSNIRPYFKDDSISSLMTNLITFNKLDLSIATGSLSENKKKWLLKNKKNVYAAEY